MAATDFKWLGAFAVDWSVIGVAFALALHFGPWAWWPAALVVGTRIHALAVIGHMAAHRYCGRFSAALMWLSFAPIGVDPDAYKRFHFAHHRAVGVPGSDPEVAVVRRFATRWHRLRKRDLLLDVCGLHLDEIGTILKTVSTRRSIVLYVAFMSVVAAVFGWTAVLWPLAAATGLLAVHRARSFTEHDHLHRPGLTFKTPPPPLWKRLVYLPHGTWLHAEHHAGVRGI